MELPETIKYEKNGRIAVVTLNRAEALNALTPDMLMALEDVWADYSADPGLWCAVFTGSGERAFCAGADLKESIPKLTSGESLGFDDPTKRQFSDVIKPVVAAVNGFCIAGGLEMLLGTDIRIAAEHATFGLGEVRWGVIPAGGSHIRLPRQVPWAIAMELLLTGGTIDAQRAYDVGLINRVVPADQLIPAAMEVAETICKNGPLAVKTAKEIAVRSLNLEAGFVLERSLSQKVMRSEDAKEGPKAFMEKRPPEFTGH
jgi:enoyl-CoA hydratase